MSVRKMYESNMSCMYNNLTLMTLFDLAEHVKLGAQYVACRNWSVNALNATHRLMKSTKLSFSESY